MNKVDNEILKWFIKYRQGVSRTIEHDLFIRQPSASTSLSKLIKMGCIEESPRMTHEVMKGRPQKEYKINIEKTKDSLSKEYENQITKLETQIKTLQNKLKEVKKWA